MKVDLCIWTLNGERTLRQCLESIDRAVPQPHCKIAVDGMSSDNTRCLLKRYGWTVIDSEAEIPKQANEALSHVDAEFFASFEQDIIVNEHWFERMKDMIHKDDNPLTLASVQGVRLLSGSRTLQIFDREFYESHTEIFRRIYSMDNNLFLTEAVRRVGGFPDSCAYSTDNLLRIELAKKGYRWLIDNYSVSKHYKPSFIEHTRSTQKALIKSTYYWGLQKNSTREILRQCIMSPVYGLKMAVKHDFPLMIFTYPFFTVSTNSVKILCQNRRESRTI